MMEMNILMESFFICVTILDRLSSLPFMAHLVYTKWLDKDVVLKFETFMYETTNS